MAMDALKNLSDNVPGWLKQLDELSGQIDLRQAELAAVAAAEGKDPETKSLRNKGSTESLRPKDDVPMEASEATPYGTRPEDAPGVAMRPSTLPTEPEQQVAASPPSPSALNQSLEAIKAARIMAKTRQRSAEGAPVTPQTRTMIIVYYDSYVQGFFNNLVRSVSLSRNFMRKAKVAANDARIKRLPGIDMSESNEDGDDEPLPSLVYMSTRRGYGPAGANGQPPDVYDRLGKSLEIVQSMCEHGAHQFLRDGDCNDEILKVRKQLTEVLKVSTAEMERIKLEEPELAKETGELGKVRITRNIRMRREMSLGLKDGLPLAPNKSDPEKLEAAKPEDWSPHLLDAEAPLEADPNTIEADERIDVAMEMPKLQYRSSRAMRSRGP
ncbi:hypothetical protein B0J13DRAFT_649461 [Dactylonectria estremocensis]|uniref:Uncharacterized protein n=1 Tax=Dactylonectria estremocensis TaxID=1079267 RepID=A0A9P9DJ24_9HYPO|nr:hypothetical protein B0J13DRAFT_649461 [Dactylonectria estremocensis]